MSIHSSGSATTRSAISISSGGPFVGIDGDDEQVLDLAVGLHLLEAADRVEVGLVVAGEDHVLDLPAGDQFGDRAGLAFHVRRAQLHDLAAPVGVEPGLLGVVADDPDEALGAVTGTAPVERLDRALVLEPDLLLDPEDVVVLVDELPGARRPLLRRGSGAGRRGRD